MDRRRLSLHFACLALLACLAPGAAELWAAPPSGGAFSWEMSGPALPGQNTARQGPRYDETYPALRSNAADNSTRAATSPARQPAAANTAASAPPASMPTAPAVVASVASPISPALQAATRDAEARVRRGTELGNRRAYYSARAEFIEAMRTVARALDVEHRTDGHTQALASGLIALDESDDFIARGMTFESQLNVPQIASVHRTPVVRSDPEGITPREALERYYTFAQEQLATSMGRQPVGSAALCALGKLYTVLAQDQPMEVQAAQAKAMALHQAALVVDTNNAVAANELGVLLARFGRLADAKAWLQHSASIAPQAATWHNLAVVHQQLGETKLAEGARQQEAALAQTTGRRAKSVMPEVRWVSPRELDAVPVDRPPAPAIGAAPQPSRGYPSTGPRSAAVPSEGVVRLPGVGQSAAPRFE